MRIVIQDGEAEHTGSTVVGSVTGTIDVGSNSFFSIGGKLIAVSDGIMVIPSHQYVVFPPLFHSHNFTPDTLQNNYFLIENNPVLLVSDSYSADATEITDAGSNTFVEVN